MVRRPRLDVELPHAQKGCVSSFITAHICDASARSWCRPTPYSIVARPRQSPLHQPLPPRGTPRAHGHGESPGRPSLTPGPGDPPMSRPPLEVADVVRQHGDVFLSVSHL